MDHDNVAVVLEVAGVAVVKMQKGPEAVKCKPPAGQGWESSHVAKANSSDAANA